MNTLLTAADLEALPPIYSTDGEGDDATVVVRLFGILNLGSWTWAITEYAPESRTAFGLVVSSMCPGELGYISLDELESATAMGGTLPLVERDAWWTPCPLGDVRAEIEVAS